MANYTTHVYYSNSLPDETSKLNCAVFPTLEKAKAAALAHYRQKGGIVDITRDREDSPDPEFVWSTHG